MKTGITGYNKNISNKHIPTTKNLERETLNAPYFLTLPLTTASLIRSVVYHQKIDLKGLLRPYPNFLPI